MVEVALGGLAGRRNGKWLRDRGQTDIDVGAETVRFD